MDKYAQLESLRTQAKAIIDNAASTAEELKRADDLIAQAVALQAEIKADEERKGRLAAVDAFMSESAGRKSAPDAKTAGAKQAAQVREPEEKFASFGEQLFAVAKASMPGTTYQDRRLKRTAAFEDMETKNNPSGLSESVPSDGGFLVQGDFAGELMKRVYETGVLASRCRRVPIGANANGLTWNSIDETSRANGSRWGGVNVYWTDEADTATASKPKLFQQELKLKKLMAVCYATEELLADSTALGSLMSQAFQEEMGYKVDDAIYRGNGVGQPKGIITDANVYVSVAKEGGQLADTILYENVQKMYSRMWAPSRSKAVWFINQDCEPQLNAMSLAIGTAGVPVYMPAGGVTGQPYATLFGRPVIAIEQADTVGDLGDIVFADLSQYIFIDKGALATSSSLHVRFLYDEMTYKFTLRCNGMPLWRSSLTPANSTNTLSPFIVLAERA